MRFFSIFLLFFSFSFSFVKADSVITFIDSPKYNSSLDVRQPLRDYKPVQGGSVTFPAFGSFDTLNPYSAKGVSPSASPGFFEYGVTELNQTLFSGLTDANPNYDEGLVGYGLLAESIQLDSNLESAVITIWPLAEFHDGISVTSDDVAFSFDQLSNNAHPKYSQQLSGVEYIEIIDNKTFRVKFSSSNNFDNLISFGSMPILPKHFWQSRDINSSLSTPPLLSGPYRVSSFEIGRNVTFSRVRNSWGDRLGLYKKRYNFDSVKFEFFRDSTVAFQSFAKGDLDAYLEYSASNWNEAYDNVNNIIQFKQTHNRPSNLQGFYFNLRKDFLSNRKVRRALSLMFDFAWYNRTLFHGSYLPLSSYFENSSSVDVSSPSLSAKALNTLRRFYDESEVKKISEYLTFRSSSFSYDKRKRKRAAMRLFQEAGLTYANNKMLAKGKPLSLSIVTNTKGMERILVPYQKSLASVGVDLSIRVVDNAQYVRLIDQRDFDMVVYTIPQSRLPAGGFDQYFGSSSASISGSNNFVGLDNSAIDQMIDLVQSTTRIDNLQPMSEALNAALLYEDIMVMNWNSPQHRIALRDNKFSFPFDNFYSEDRPANSPGIDYWSVK
ncbi:hypothetical protein A3715_00060 [Oleiphilus sp. HI0009]|nr:hypothetical protein A3715_00060 [Oleiphilus sp. HI0009]